jgi:hypothetical protein
LLDKDNMQIATSSARHQRILAMLRDRGGIRIADLPGELRARGQQLVQPPDSPLHSLDNLILTSHTAWYSEESAPRRFEWVG